MFNFSRSSLFILGGLLFVILGSVLFVVLGVTVVQSYVSESNYKRTNCSVRAVEYHKQNSKDDWYRCPWQCTINHTPDGLKTFCELSEFPCLRIVVDVATKHGLKTAILHENPEKMNKYSDCSTYYCDRDSVVNEKLVNRFRKAYGMIGTHYKCFFDLNSLQSDDYDDDGQEHALLKLSFNEASYVNSLLWPSVAFVAGVVLIFYGLHQRFFVERKEEKKKRSLLDNGL